jgi:hypothetical protein
MVVTLPYAFNELISRPNAYKNTYQIPKDTFIDLNKGLKINYTVDITGIDNKDDIDLNKSFNIFNLDSIILKDVFNLDPFLSVNFGNKRETFNHEFVTKRETVYEKMYDILDKEYPSWRYNIKKIININETLR